MLQARQIGALIIALALLTTITTPAAANELQLKRADRLFADAITISAVQSRPTWFIRARRKLDQGREICEKTGDQKCLGEFYFAQGQVQKSADQMPESIASFETSYRIFSELGFPLRQAGVAFELGNAQLIVENAAEACVLYQRSIDLFTEGQTANVPGDEAPPVLNPDFKTFDELVKAFQDTYCLRQRR